MSNPVLLNEPDYIHSTAADLVVSAPTPSAGYFHVMPADVPGRVHLVRTSIPMGAKAFANKLPTLVQWENFVWVGNVDIHLAEACIEGLNRTNKGILDAHAKALEDAKAAVGRKYYVRAVMYCPEAGGWWVTLGGPRRFRNWRELGLYSATTALFTDWDDLRAMQYEPHEHDVSNYVSINVNKMLDNAGIKLKKLKKHPSWYDATTPKPYISSAGAATETVMPQPLDPAAYPVHSAQCDGLDGLLPAGYVAEPAALMPLHQGQHQGAQLPQQTYPPQVYDRAAEDAREARELEERLAAMRRGAGTEIKFWDN